MTIESDTTTGNTMATPGGAAGSAPPSYVQANWRERGVGRRSRRGWLRPDRLTGRASTASARRPDTELARGDMSNGADNAPALYEWFSRERKTSRLEPRHTPSGSAIRTAPAASSGEPRARSTRPRSAASRTRSSSPTARSTSTLAPAATEQASRSTRPATATLGTA